MPVLDMLVGYVEANKLLRSLEGDTTKTKSINNLSYATLTG